MRNFQLMNRYLIIIGWLTDHYEMVSSHNIFCSEVERELGMLFSKGGGSGVGTKSKYSGSKFSMVVEDLTEGVLVSS